MGWQNLKSVIRRDKIKSGLWRGQRKLDINKLSKKMYKGNKKGRRK